MNVLNVIPINYRLKGLLFSCPAVLTRSACTIRIRRREWSSVAAVTAACQGVMELRGVHRRKWSRIVAVIVAWECRSAG